jgi:hypothetical protein
VDIAVEPSEETLVHAQEVWVTGSTVTGSVGLSAGSFDKSLKKNSQYCIRIDGRRHTAGTPQTSLIDYYLEILFGNSCKNIMSLFDDGDEFGFLHNHRGEEENSIDGPQRLAASFSFATQEEEHEYGKEDSDNEASLGEEDEPSVEGGTYIDDDDFGFLSHCGDGEDKSN